MEFQRNSIPIAKKLKRNECIAKESEDGLTLLKRKDKRDVLLLSTRRNNRCTEKRKGLHKTKNCYRL